MGKVVDFPYRQPLISVSVSTIFEDEHVALMKIITSNGHETAVDYELVDYRENEPEA